MKWLQRSTQSLLIILLFCVAVSKADDTDIYLGTSGSAAGAGGNINPNIMFIIDTSGSMAGTDGGSQSRLERVQEALSNKLSTANNVNVGLMRFNEQNGGPVLYPVADIDSVAQSNDQMVTVSIDSGSDDAEELQSDGSMTVTGTDAETLEFINVPSSGSSFLPGTRPSSSSDGLYESYTVAVNDAYEQAGGITYCGNPELYLDNAANSFVRTNFLSVPIPVGATIIHAEVQFAVRNEETGNVDIKAWGEANVNPSAAAMNCDDATLAEISALPKTTLSVDWDNLVHPASRDRLVSPDLSTLVQEIIDMPGWLTGNNLSLLFQGNGHNDKRDVYSENHFSGNDNDGNDLRPVLRVVFADATSTVTELALRIDGNNFDVEQAPGSDNYNSTDLEFGRYFANPLNVGLRFDQVVIPSGANILYAELEFVTRGQTGEDSGLTTDNLSPSNSNQIRDAHSTVEAYDSDNATLNLSSTSNAVRLETLNRLQDDTATTITIDWKNMGAPDYGGKVLSPDIGDLVQRIVNHGLGGQSGDWQSGNDMIFLLQDGPYNTSANAWRAMEAHNNDASKAPLLRVYYSDPVSAPGVDQFVGLRFAGVNVPTGVTVTNASIELIASGSTSTSTVLDIYAELPADGDADSYSTTASDISGRSYTSDKVIWSGAAVGDTDPIESWVTGNAYQSPDLTTLVQQVVNDTNWCGGNAMAFMVDGAGRKLGWGYDGNANDAAVLRIEYDDSGLTAATTDGCITGEVTVQISAGSDDAEEAVVTGGMNTGSGDLELGQDGSEEQIIGLIFEGVDVPEGAEILSADLEFYVDNSGGVNPTSPSSIMNITAQAPATYGSSSFFQSSNSDISGRTKIIGFSALWTIPAFSSVAPVTFAGSSDFADLIEEVVGDASWVQGDPVILFLQGTSGNTGERETESRNGYATRAPKLTIRYRKFLDAGTSQQTVREYLIEIVDQLNDYGSTPIVDTLYEAAKYYGADPVYFGLTRGGGPSLGTDDMADINNDRYPFEEAEFTRTSHWASFSGTPTYDHSRDINGNGTADCALNNPNAYDCKAEEITTPHNYISPLGEACQANYLVLLTDGQPTVNASAALIPGDKTVGASCSAQIFQAATGTDRNPSSDEMCGVDVAKYLREVDQHSNDGEQVVITHTMGLSLTGNAAATDFLKEIAAEGGGNYFDVDSGDSLDSAFDTIIKAAIQANTSFVSPSLSVNAFNRLFNRNFVYFNLFHTTSAIGWDGNLKKYALCTDGDSLACDFGEVIDKSGDAAVHTDPASPLFGSLMGDSTGFWSTACVGDACNDTLVITEDGAGGKTLPFGTRVVYTGTAQSNATLHLLTDDNDAQTTATTYRTSLQTDFGYCTSGTTAEKQACLDGLVLHVLGKRSNVANQEEGYDANNRWVYADGIHSRPLVLTYGFQGSVDEPISRLFIGTNDGSFRGINDGDAAGNRGGEEEFVVYPWQTMDRQEDLMLSTSSTTDDHVYGLDATPTARIKDVDGDGIIEPGSTGNDDFVHVFIGMRRNGGYKGRSLFAFDVSPDNATGLVNTKTGNTAYTDSDASNKITPTMLWTIDAEDSTDADYASFNSGLGQTWSTPKPTLILDANSSNTAVVEKAVVIFGGGYDPNNWDGGLWAGTASETGTPATDQYGNAIFIIDADNGDLLWWASSALTATNSVTDMKYSFPSDITLLDTNLDGITDRLYAVDVAGQVWRVDLQASASNGLADSTIGKLADLSDPATATERRKFFYAPEVAQVEDSEFSDEPIYDMLAIASGDRADPLHPDLDLGETDVVDRVYILRDYLTGSINSLIDSTASNFPKCADGNTCSGVLTNSNLLDVTNINFENSTDFTSQIDNLKASEGWYITFDTTGEKGFSQLTILDGTAYFTTFYPGADSGSLSCDPALGSSNLYAVNVFSGAPVFAHWSGDATDFELGDRSQSLGKGPSARVVPAYLKPGVTLVVPTGAGAVAQDPQVEQRLFKTFWYQ